MFPFIWKTAPSTWLIGARRFEVWRISHNEVGHAVAQFFEVLQYKP
jgi:hypothetical protein